VLMAPDTIPEYDYPYLPGEELNPLLESSLHFRWVTMLCAVVRHTLSDIGSDALVTGNTPFAVSARLYTAPDLMVLPGMRGREFGLYRVGSDGPPPTACIEVRSPSNTDAIIARRLGAWLEVGVGEVYLIEPELETVQRVELIGGELRFSAAVGSHSPAMNLTFGVLNRRLVLCCPAGRPVGIDDDSYAWLADEQRRADRAELRSDRDAMRAAEAEARAVRAEAELAELRRRHDRP
jgi:Uma2 family endonuclease